MAIGNIKGLIREAEEMVEMKTNSRPSGYSLSEVGEVVDGCECAVKGDLLRHVVEELDVPLHHLNCEGGVGRVAGENNAVGDQVRGASR